MTEQALGVSDDTRDLVGQFLKTPDAEFAAVAAKPVVAAPPVAAAATPPAVSSEAPVTQPMTPADMLNMLRQGAPVAKPPVAQPPAPPVATPPPASDSPFPADLGDAEAPPVAAPPVVEDLAAQQEAAEDTRVQAEIAKFDPKVKEAIMRERQANKQLREDNKALRAAQEAASKTAVAPPEELQKLQTQLDAEKQARTKLEEQIGQIDLSQSPQFKDAFDNKIQGLYTRAIKELVKDGLDAPAARQLVQQAAQMAKPSEREALFANEASGVAMTLTGLFSTVDELRENRAVALSNWRQTKSAQEESAVKNTSYAMSTRIEQDVNDAIAVLRTEKNGYYMESPSNQEWNSAVAQRVQTLKGVLHRQDPKQVVRLIADGLTAPEFRKLYATSQAQFAALKVQHDKLLADFQAIDKRSLPLGGRGWTPGIPGADTGKPKIEGATVEDAARNFLR